MVFGLGLPAKVAFGVMHGLVPVAILVMNAIGMNATGTIVAVAIVISTVAVTVTVTVNRLPVRWSPQKHVEYNRHVIIKLLSPRLFYNGGISPV